MLRFCGVHETKVAAVYNGIDHSVFRPSVAGVRRFEFPYFLYIARLEHPAKNHIRLIEAFELFHERMNGKSPHRLVLGGADWHGAEEVHARIRSSSVKDRIVVLGFVDAAELPYRLVDRGLERAEPVVCRRRAQAVRVQCGPELSGGAAPLAPPFDLREPELGDPREAVTDPSRAFCLEEEACERLNVLRAEAEDASGLTLRDYVDVDLIAAQAQLAQRLRDRLVDCPAARLRYAHWWSSIRSGPRWGRPGAG